MVSPIAINTAKQSMSDGRSANTMFVVSPLVVVLNKSDGSPNMNMCRDIVLSPQPQQATGSASNKQQFQQPLHPASKKQQCQTTITPKVLDVVKGVSDSFNKHQVQQARISGKKTNASRL